jgi:hypothetical protein
VAAGRAGQGRGYKSYNKNIEVFMKLKNRTRVLAANVLGVAGAGLFNYLFFKNNLSLAKTLLGIVLILAITCPIVFMSVKNGENKASKS